MKNTRYIFDPGLPGETGFYYPENWEPRDNWPSADGLQAEAWDDYLDVEDKGKLFHGVISGGEKQMTIFVNSQEELLEYMKFYGIEVTTEDGFSCNSGKVYPTFMGE